MPLSPKPPLGVPLESLPCCPGVRLPPPPPGVRRGLTNGSVFAPVPASRPAMYAFFNNCFSTEKRCFSEEPEKAKTREIMTDLSDCLVFSPLPWESSHSHLVVFADHRSVGCCCILLPSHDLFSRLLHHPHLLRLLFYPFRLPLLSNLLPHLPTYSHLCSLVQACTIIMSRQVVVD